MVGVGRTVFSGSKLEDFKVDVLGVLRNVIGPKRNLILARLEGGPLAKTGVIAGMSGSPVYVDGRLMGAVSYALGQFATEPIGGITPIAEMTDATAMQAPHAGHASGGAVVAGVAARAARRSGRGTWAARARSSTIRRRRCVLSGVSGDLGRMARCCGRSRCRWSPAGFDLSVIAPLSAAFTAAGFLPVSSSTGAIGPGIGARRAAHTLAPGDAVGVALLTGDFELGATGTVTHVDGDRVYAFGHPLYNLGPDRISDDEGRSAGRAAEPDVVEQAGQLRRGRRHPAAGSRDGDRRPARRRAVADPGDHHAQLRSRAVAARSPSASSATSRSRRS